MLERVQLNQGQKFKEFAPAKLNLFLHLIEKQPDGYHQIESLFAFAKDVGDWVKCESADCFSLSLTGPFAAKLKDEQIETNLVYKAIAACWQATGHTGMPNIAVILDKHLPPASGIGGGSSDAAAAIRLVRRALNLRLEKTALDQIALMLGADVLACLDPHAQWIAGIGEKSKPVSQLPKLFALMANPGVAVSTAHVFQNRKPLYSKPLGPGIDSDVSSITALSRNDLQDAAIALEPAIANLLTDVESLPGCQLARMSGSGATCFGLFGSMPAAAAAANALNSSAGPAWIAVSELI